ncbi:MAG: DUF502 domain-containing protein [Gemmatimonadetes bacterium]|nr:DUF502 domain-containing protein [Gemmatimonadota bacterium]
MESSGPQHRPWRIKARMASGLVVLIPLVVTIAVIRFVFSFTSGILLPFLDPALAAWPAVARAALSLAILLVTIYALGVVATQAVGRRVLALGEAIVLKVPFVKVVYSASKQVVATFQGQKSQAFKSVVFVEFPHPGARSLGFVTSRLRRPDGSEWNLVFVPTTPNPTTGFLQMIPVDRVVPADMTVEDGVKLVMSLGVLTPEQWNTTQIAPVGEAETSIVRA